MSTHFSYPDVNQGLHDLELFSGMNCNENRTLYLCEMPVPPSAPNPIWQIHHSLQSPGINIGVCSPVVAIALNGIVYTK